MEKIIRQETICLTKNAILLDALCLIVTWLLGQPSKPIALGLLFGTVFLLFHFQLIGISVKKSLNSDSPQTAKCQMIMDALARYGLSGAVIWLGIQLSFLNVFAVVFPMLYPKIIYYLGAVREQLCKSKEEKR